jgi:prepilin-type N-terminal cleavage/methylation domain-containing protein
MEGTSAAVPRRPYLRRLREERGFTLLEMVVAMVVFATITTPIAGVMTASLKAHRASQERTLAEEAAAQQIETIRALPYTSVGLVNGNPPGTVVASQPVTATGISATLTTQVSFVDDPTRTGFVTGADYKRVVATVTNTAGKQLTRASTYVAPSSRGEYGGINGALARVQVVDFALNQPVVNAPVALATGPSAPRNDLTDASGTVVFAGLTANPVSGANSYYDLTTTPSGYVTLNDDLPPGGAARVQLAPGQTFNTALRVYKPATIDVRLTDSTGALFTGAATVTVASPRGAQSFPVSNGLLTVTTVAGEQIVPSLSYSVGAYSSTGRWAPSVAKVVPDAYPTVLSSSFALTLGATAPTTRSLTVRTTNASGTTLAGARVDVTGGPSQTTLTATSNASGVATFTVPSGNAYTVTGTGPNRVGSGTWSGNVTSNTSATVRIA